MVKSQLFPGAAAEATEAAGARATRARLGVRLLGGPSASERGRVGRSRNTSSFLLLRAIASNLGIGIGVGSCWIFESNALWTLDHGGFHGGDQVAWHACFFTAEVIGWTSLPGCGRRTRFLPAESRSLSPIESRVKLQVQPRRFETRQSPACPLLLILPLLPSANVDTSNLVGNCGFGAYSAEKKRP